MIRKTCPYLGLKDDPDTALNFPSVGNFCHHAAPVTQVKGAYQRKYCLTGEHVNCPLFQAAQPVPPTAAIAADGGLLAGPRRKLVLVGVPALLAGSAALFLAWNVFGAQLILARQSIPDTGNATLPSASFAIIGAPVNPQPTVAPSLTPTLTQEPSPTACALPDGWMMYTVNPTDSLYRLSVIYGVAIEELQRVNCMGSNIMLKPGDVIYVPMLPTETPTPTNTFIPPTFTPRPAPPEQSAPQNNNNSNDQPAPQPTAVPPTAVPAQPQPTSAPQQPPPPPQQKPPQQPPPQNNPPPKNNDGGGNHNGGGNGNGNGGGNHGGKGGKGGKGGG